MNFAAVRIHVRLGNLPEQEYCFTERTRCIIGRADDCDIQFPSDYLHADVSRHHCVLDIDPPSIRVRDLGSRNGTYVNGTKIGQRFSSDPVDGEADGYSPHELGDGDEVQVGHMVLQVGIAHSEYETESVCMPMYFV